MENGSEEKDNSINLVRIDLYSLFARWGYAIRGSSNGGDNL